TEKNTSNRNPVFFDRSLLDTLCYAKLIDSEINAEMQSYAEHWRYNKKVFMLPPWREIYQTDHQRKQDWDEVLLTHIKMKETYNNYGYQIIEVPKVKVESRVSFVLGFIKKQKNK